MRHFGPRRPWMLAASVPLALAACAAPAVSPTMGTDEPPPVPIVAAQAPVPATVPVVLDGRPAAGPAGPGVAPGGPADGPLADPAAPGGATTPPRSSGGGGKGGGGRGVTAVPPAPSADPAAGASPDAGPTPGGATPTPGATATPVPADGPLAIVAATATAAATGYGAERAVDGNLATEYAGTGALTLGFNRLATVASVQLKTGPAGYVVEGSADGATWTPVLTATNTGWNLETKALPTPVVAQHLRVRPAGTTRLSVFEIKVQAASTGTTPPPAGGTGTAIVVSPDRVLHAADSHVLGTNRNHVQGDFPNGAAKLQALKALRPTWGDRKYLYRIGHGPTDGRHDYTYMTGFHFEQTWDQHKSYPYDDVRNALADASALGADQMHVVNFGTSDPEEAGRYVSFLNKAGDANRAAHPAAQQNVRMFELGNEIAWSMVRGHAEYAATDTMYAQRAKLFAQKMRASSDVPIRIGAVASINSNWEGNGWAGGATTVKNILTTMGDQVDFLIFHGYPSWPLYKTNDLWSLMAQNAWSHRKLETEIEPAIRQYGGGREIGIANTEFFPHMYNDVTRSRGMYGALYSADSVILALNHNFRSAVQFCFEHKDQADAGFFMNNDATKTTAIFKFQQLLAEHWGDQVVATAGQDVPAQTVVGASTTIDVPKLSFSAATAGGKAFLLVVNRTPDADVTARVDAGFTPSAARGWELSGAGGWDAANGEVKAIAGPSLAGYTFPKASITLFELTR